MNAVKLIILDRDGTVNEDRDDYVKSPIPLENFMGNAGERPGNVSRIHHQPFLGTIL